MNIRRQVIFSSLMALLVVAALVAAHWLRLRERAQETADRAFTDYLEQGISDLRWLAIETALYQAERSREQWLAKHVEIERALAAFPHRTEQWDQIVAQINESVGVLDTLYERLLALGAVRGKQRDPELQARTVSSMMVTSHQLHDLIIRLVKERRQIIGLRETRIERLIAAMLGILAATLLMLVGVVFWRVLKPIKELQDAMQSIAAGDLSHRLNFAASGEVAQLASSFNQMTEALQQSTNNLDTARRESVDYSLRLERLNAFQRAVFDQAPDGILVADEDGRIVEANDRLASLFGWTREELTERMVDDLVPASYRAAHQLHRRGFRDMPATRAMGQNRLLDGVRADGRIFPVEVALSPMQSSDGFRVIAIVKDVSAARQAEQAVRDALKEKDLLLGEIHHRVKNNLQIVHSLLDMQTGLTSDARAAEALRDSQNRIQSMALIHQTLYQSHDFARVDFGRFLDTLAKHLHDSFGRPELEISSQAESVYLAIDRAIPCGLIVNELVTNSLKHAFPGGRPGKVWVQMRLLRDVDVEVTVSDDGVGLPGGFNANTSGSLGMQLVQVLTEQLHAELDICSREPTRFAFVFPREDA